MLSQCQCTNSGTVYAGQPNASIITVHQLHLSAISRLPQNHEIESDPSLFIVKVSTKTDIVYKHPRQPKLNM